MHGRRARPPRWRYRASLNGLGAAVTAVMLIPVALPDRLRYRFLHNHIGLVLTRALRYRLDVVAARVPVRVHIHGRAAGRYQPGGCARP